MEELIIKKDLKDAIVKAIAESVIPTNVGIQIINTLNSLQPLKVTKKE